jgi:hypothetical protein
LVFNIGNGQVSGIPTSPKATTTYVVTAVNAAGSSNTNLTLTINPVPVPVPAISYISPQSYQVGSPITPLNVSSTGGAVASYSGTLPSGLSLNASTGQITGIPTAVQSATVYNVIGTNASGSSTAHITITITAIPLASPSISYSPAYRVNTYGYAAVPMNAFNSGGTVTSWSISPSLPSGLTFNSGAITGIPVAISAATAYTVTATNATGSSHTTVTIAVQKAPLSLVCLSTSRQQGQSNPTFQYALTGLVAGDTNIDTSPTLSSTATTGSPVGTYPITATGYSSTKYSITPVSGNLTVYNGAVVFGMIFGGYKP